MGETVNQRFHRALQNESNISSVWCQWEDSKTTPLSANSNNDCVGRGSPTLDDLHYENGFHRANRASGPKTISFKNVSYLSKKDYVDGTESEGSPNSNKCNSISEKREDQLYVRDVGSQWNSNENSHKKDVAQKQPINIRVESEEYSDTAQFECCPNSGEVRRLQLSLGKLCRIGTLVGNVWTEEKPKTPCHLVVPDIQYKGETIPKAMLHVSMGEKEDESREGRNNPFIIIEMIADKLDRKRVAEILGRHVEKRTPTTYKYYLEDVKEYGFNHIILIGDCYAGFLFLDCYGRVFEWEDSMDVLWALGDYWSMVSKESQTRRVIWGVEYDGIITEFEDGLPNKLSTFDQPATKTIDVHPVAKKKKNSKKKNSKKKQH